MVLSRNPEKISPQLEQISWENRFVVSCVFIRSFPFVTIVSVIYEQTAQRSGPKANYPCRTLLEKKKPNAPDKRKKRIGFDSLKKLTTTILNIRPGHSSLPRT